MANFFVVPKWKEQDSQCEDSQCTHKVTLSRVRAATVAVEEQQVLHILKCVYKALRIQHLMPVRHIVMCGLFGCTVFSTLSLKRYDFRKKKGIEPKMCVLIFSTNFISNVYYSKQN